MIKITNEKQCCGCGSCIAVCPVNCIVTTTRSLGAVFPLVDENRCINCGKCEAVCPLLHVEQQMYFGEQQVYAAYAKDDRVRFLGSSGGIFGVIAKSLITKGYTVFGAAFNEQMKLCCTPARTENDLIPLMKSKYLQSQLTHQYEPIRKMLIRGEKVMFVSTPCQVAALKQYLGKAYSNLITVDFICHGVPSQELFDRCIEYEDKKYHHETVGYQFRTKIQNGATPHYYTASVRKKDTQREITAPYFHSVFYALFQRYITLRESCYDCVFAERNRVSDLTIGDFHEIEEYIPGIDRFDGVSKIIVNTANGQALLESIRDLIWHRAIPLEKLIADGVLFAEKTKRPAERDALIEGYYNLDFDTFVRRNRMSMKYFVFEIYYRLPKCLRNVAKKICGI